MTTETPKGKQGFASMDRERVREIARKGGKTAQANGTAHRWNSEAAQAAGKKGQAALKASGKRYQWDSERAREAAKKGWEKRRKGRGNE